MNRIPLIALGVALVANTPALAGGPYRLASPGHCINVDSQRVAASKCAAKPTAADKSCINLNTKKPAPCGSPNSEPAPFAVGGPYVGLKWVGDVGH